MNSNGDETDLYTSRQYKMVATTWKVGGCNHEISVNIKWSTLKSKENIVQSESVKSSDSVRNENLLAFRLVFDELQELQKMST
jgi:hypothetical protein